ncbi:DUF2771 domain-containing protein [Corynebacterium endometrii]|uniref:DUF2771 domain-containing protein n=1 Tax=Corynebacterium endometrii TaxID=2488819 RepID=A0A4V1CEF7_9CORY|nr:DUF2771 domain-containing protein [Corynebacterium endometrii]QCB27948.1 hypothetical protein CENDO_03270 [Corynebacterium endometrii]
MATRKEAQRKSLLQILALIIAVVVIVVGVVLFQSWINNRPGAEPKDVAITATVGDNSMEVFPYIACEPGLECPEGEVPNLTVGPDETLKIEIPEEVSNHQWKILTIYDDVAANDEKLHGANETSEVEVPGSVDVIDISTSGETGQRPQLKVVEITSVMIGTDANGEEAPFTTVWSLSTMTDEELAAEQNAPQNGEQEAR